MIDIYLQHYLQNSYVKLYYEKFRWASLACLSYVWKRKEEEEYDDFNQG